jgi:hypothetical protein
VLMTEKGAATATLANRPNPYLLRPVFLPLSRK